ncbi:MAG: diacylglycerol kinase family lipid kinase [Oscillospiraceae bacterium]|nr:diacylglycerol kinase family lipid kinase [Oscillospiraceae bacterium]
MKHVFVINPAAGKRDQTMEFTNAIRAACAGLNYDIRLSARPGDGARLARSAARLGDPVRFYACGGDGTLNEVVNGVVGYPNAAVTHFPGGSGNDFIKIFSDPKAFQSLERLLDDPEEASFDLIRCPGDRYGLNICSMGFDARVGTDMSKFKHWPLVTGSGAYLLSVVSNLVKGVHEHYVVELDGQVFDARQTLICIASGRWYGGGFNPVPDALPDDGLLEVLLVKDVSRLTVAKVVGAYKKGRYKELPELVRHFSCKKVTIRCDQESVINVDGELLRAREATFQVVPQAIRFFYPRGLTYK